VASSLFLLDRRPRSVAKPNFLVVPDPEALDEDDDGAGAAAVLVVGVVDAWATAAPSAGGAPCLLRRSVDMALSTSEPRFSVAWLGAATAALPPLPCFVGTTCERTCVINSWAPFPVMPK